MTSWKERLAKYSMIMLCVGCCILGMCTKIYAQKIKHDRVLFLSSYAYDWESVPEQLDGINEVLDGRAKLDYIFMDTKREAYENIKGKIYNQIKRYEEQKGNYDAVILGDDTALRFAIEYKDVLFKEAPVVFEGINNAKMAYRAAKGKYMTGLIEQMPVKETLELATEIYPKAERVVAIVDGTEAAAGSLEQYYAVREDFPELDFQQLMCERYTDKEIAKKLGQYDDKTILLHLVFSRDKQGNEYSITEAAEFVSKYANVPVFRLDELGIGSGFLGGTVISVKQMAMQAAEIVKMALDGNKISNIEVRTTEQKIIFDKNVMEKFQIEKGMLPKETQYVNEAPSFYEKYKRIVKVLLCIFIVAMILLAITVQDNIRRRKLYKEMKEKDGTLNQIMSTMPGGIFLYEIEDQTVRYQFYTDGLEDILGMKRKEIDQHFQQGDFLRTVIHPDDYDKFVHEIQKSFHYEEQIDLSFRLSQIDRENDEVHLKAVKIQQTARGACYCAVVMTTPKLEKGYMNIIDAAIQHSQIAYWEVDLKNDTLKWGSQAKKQFGLPVNVDHMPQGWLNTGVMKPEYNEQYNEMYANLKKGQSSDIEVEIRDAETGKMRWKKVRHTIIWDESGMPCRAIGTGIDITGLKKMEKRYNEQVAYNNSLVETRAFMRFNLTDNRIFHIQEKNNLIQEYLLHQPYDDWVNLEANRSNAEYYKTFYDTFSRETLLEAFDAGISVSELDRPVMLEGQKCWIHCEVHLMHNPIDGKVEGYVAETDITEKKNFEMLLLRLVSVAYEYMIEVNLNTEEYRLLSSEGENFKSIPEKGTFDVVRSHYPEKVRQQLETGYMREHLEKENVYDINADIFLDEDDIKSYKIQVFYIDKEAQRVCVTCADVTESIMRERKISELMAEALDRAESASKAKGEFLSNMSHEIRTPMNAIIGLTKLAKGELNDTENAIQGYLKQIDDSSTYLLGLLNDILDMSRIESGKFELSPEWCYLNDIVETCVKMIEPQMQEKKIHFDYPKGNPVLNDVQFYLDPLRVQQIIMNLLNNAMKFTDPGGTVRLYFENIRNDKDIAVDRIIVSDTGCGMSKEFQKRMFRPFEQEQNKYSGKVHGTGLGLALVQKIVEESGGEIIVNSELNKGSIFILTMSYKYRCKKREDIVEKLPEEQNEHGSLTGKCVLLVEDNEINMMLARKILEKKKILIETAENGKVAVDKFRESDENYYDAILMDNRMPVMSGNEAARQIRKLDRKDATTVPIIAMTADAFYQDELQSLKAGMNDHLSKPVSAEKLYETLEKWIMHGINE